MIEVLNLGPTAQSGPPFSILGLMGENAKRDKDVSAGKYGVCPVSHRNHSPPFHFFPPSTRMQLPGSIFLSHERIMHT